MWWSIAAAWAQQTVCPDSLGIPCDHPTIGAAIAAALPEVPIRFDVWESTYVENDLLIDERKHITFAGLGAVTLRGTLGQSTLSVTEGATLVLEGITVSGTNLRAARVGEGARLELYDSVVYTVGLVPEGAGVVVFRGDLRVVDSLFLNSSAVSRGGHVSAIDAHLLIERTRFLGGLAGEGGALYIGGEIEPRSATLWDVDFEDNRATGRGGAVFVEGPVDFTMIGGSFVDNFAADGGALATGLLSGADLDLTGVRFEGNEADGDGGALFLPTGHVDLVDVALVENVAGNAGGAIDIGSAGSVRQVRSLLCRNEAITGGAVRTRSGTEQTWSNGRFVDNAAQRGGAVDHANARLRLEHHSFLGNAAPDGAAVFTSGPVGVVDSLVAHQAAGTALVTVEGAALTESYVVTWENQLGNRTEVDSRGPNVEEADPLLRGYQPGRTCDEIGDFHSWYGPLVDAGNPTAGKDPDGSAADIGAWGGPLADPWVWFGDLDDDGFGPLYDCFEGNAFVFPDPDPTDGFTHDKPYDDVDQDCDGGDDFDFDRDGFPRAEDCDDNDPETYPGAPEAPGRGDQNCDGLDDADGDGVEFGEDCDDGDPRILPGVAEDPDPSVDRDCDGTADVVRPLVPASCATAPSAAGWLIPLGVLLVGRRK